MRSWLPLLPFLAAAIPVHADPALTIYNQDFAVVRETIPLDLKSGVNDVPFADATSQLEPDSVILRDPAGKVAFTVLEQNYRADAATEPLLLSLFEGKTIDFLVQQPNAAAQIVPGKIVRSGYVPNGGAAGQPIIEVNGKVRFGLPGQPQFPGLGDGTILKPTIQWKIESDAPAKLDAELAYVTGGISWHADYSLLSPENGDEIDLTGLVTIDNKCGKTFTNAHIKLMAGEVNKIQPPPVMREMAGDSSATVAGLPPPAVTEKAFDEYHLYSLPRPTDLQDKETKQVEFVRAEGVQSQRIYLYDGATDNQGDYSGDASDSERADPDFGTTSNTHIAVIHEFKNSEANHLGVPLPRGRVRFYRRDSDGQIEFTGENTIDHTPKDETLRLYTGQAFDLAGERKRTSFHVQDKRGHADESFEIKLRNHKKEPVEIRVEEHLYRGENWEITAASMKWEKIDAQKIEFRVPVAPDQEQTVTYTVHYSW